MPEAENHLLPGGTNDSWRAWLMTGARRAPVDRRRIRGAHKGLKKMLVEGMGNGGERPHVWKDFSGAMVRHAVDEALGTLPSTDKQVVKLAYFGGMSNREIASEVGLTEATVQRRLRRALSAISEHIQQGRTLGRRAVYALLVWLGARSLGDSVHQASQAVLVIAAATIVISQPAPEAAAAAPAAPAPAGQSAPQAAMPSAATPFMPSATAAAAPAQPAATDQTVQSAPAPPVQAPSVAAPPVEAPPVQAPPLPAPPVQVPPVPVPVNLPPVNVPPLPTPLPSPPVNLP